MMSIWFPEEAEIFIFPIVSGSALGPAHSTFYPNGTKNPFSKNKAAMT